MKQSNRRIDWAWTLGVWLPVAILLVVILVFSVNAPWFDDFDPFPDFLRKWRNATSFLERGALILQPNNEHRMVFGKLAVLLGYSLTNSLNFTYLHLVGFGFTLGTFGIWYKVFQENGLPSKTLLPVSLFLFQWQYQMVFLWAICSLQHQPVVFFVCLSMYLLSKRYLGWALLSGVCANFAMSNGIFVWVGGAAILLYQRSFRSLLVWGGMGALSVFAYFYGMTTMGNEQSFTYLKQHPGETFFGFFTFLGGLFDFWPERSIDFRKILPILAGLVLGGILAWWQWKIWKSWWNELATPKTSSPMTSFLIGVLIFLLANASVIALLRPRFGFFVMVVSNYKLYPALYMSVIYAGVLSMGSLAWKDKIWKGAVIMSLLVWLLSTVHYGPQMVERRKEYHINAYNQQYNGFGLGHVPYSSAAAYVTALMDTLQNAHIYRYPTTFERYIEASKRVSSAPNPMFGAVIVADTAQQNWQISMPYLPTWGLNDGVYAFLRSPDHYYVFRMAQRLYQGKNLLRRYEKSVDLQLSADIILPGQYELGFFQIENNEIIKMGIQQEITINPKTK